MKHAVGIAMIVLAAIAFARLLTVSRIPAAQRVAHPIVAFALLLVGSRLV